MLISHHFGFSSDRNIAERSRGSCYQHMLCDLLINGVTVHFVNECFRFSRNKSLSEVERKKPAAWFLVRPRHKQQWQIFEIWNSNDDDHFHNATVMNGIQISIANANNMHQSFGDYRIDWYPKNENYIIGNSGALAFHKNAKKFILKTFVESHFRNGMTKSWNKTCALVPQISDDIIHLNRWRKIRSPTE